MVCNLSWLFATIFLLTVAVQSQAQRDVNKSTENNKNAPAVAAAPTQGNVAEVVVESSLRVNSKTAKRTKRDPAQVLPAHLEYLSSLPLNRVKRQRHHHHRPQGVGGNRGFGNPGFGNPGFGNPGFGNPFPQQNYGSQATSQSNAHGHNYNPATGQFGAADALSGAQAFQSGGPNPFGASATNNNVQSFQAGPNGLSGSAGQSGTQVYNLPGGHSINVAYNGGFSVGPNGRPATSQGNSITYTR